MLTVDKSHINIWGLVYLKAFSPDHKLILEHTGPNLVTAAGKGRVASIFATNDLSFRIPAYMKIGDGSTPPTDADTNLSGSILASSLSGILHSANEVSFTALFSNAGGVDWIVNEAGLFTDAPESLLFARFLTPRFIVNPAGYCTILWKIGFGSPPTF